MCIKSMELVLLLYCLHRSILQLANCEKGTIQSMVVVYFGVWSAC